MKYGDSEFDFKKYLKLAILALLVLLVGGFLWNWVNSPMVVTVTGTGEVSAPAEAATITFSITASDVDSSNAINIVRARAESIREILKARGIAQEDIVESQVRVVPASTLVQGASGFQAVITMGAKTVHVEDLSNLISTLYSSGASLVSQPVLSAEEREELEQTAFDEALKDAKRQAARIGTKNLKFIRKIVAISQATSPSTSTVTSKADVITETQSQVAATSGVFKIVKAVSVSYKMW